MIAGAPLCVTKNQIPSTMSTVGFHTTKHTAFASDFAVIGRAQPGTTNQIAVIRSQPSRMFNTLENRLLRSRSCEQYYGYSDLGGISNSSPDLAPKLFQPIGLVTQWIASSSLEHTLRRLYPSPAIAEKKMKRSDDSIKIYKGSCERNQKVSPSCFEIPRHFPDSQSTM